MIIIIIQPMMRSMEVFFLWWTELKGKKNYSFELYVETKVTQLKCDVARGKMKPHSVQT